MKKHYLRLVRRTFRALRHPRLRHRKWWQRLSAPLFRRTLWQPCRDSVASGLAAGLFFAVMPMPFQTVPAVLFAMRFRGNVPIAMAACWLTNPFTQVPVTWFQFRLGEWLRTTLSIPMPHFLVQADLVLPGAGHFNVAGFVLGFLTSGVVLALAAFPLVHLFSAMLPHYLPALRHRPRPPKLTPDPG
ncbi:MAG: hypothetical protein RLZZ522_1090 [Verrucomicrobiota bacterium]|jgi:uncharacterized protein (DUF2062 family)